MAELLAILDYALSGRSIQYALVDHAKRFPDKTIRPKYILWNGLRIWNTDGIPVPNKGIVKVEILSADPTVRQGFDLKLHDGSIELAHGERVSLLRTWKDEQHEDTVEYPFFSADGLLWTWNVYEMTYPKGKTVEEKWTGNAGFWVEQDTPTERIYHCSHGMASSPDFASFVYKVSVRPI